MEKALYVVDKNHNDGKLNKLEGMVTFSESESSRTSFPKLKIRLDNQKEVIIQGCTNRIDCGEFLIVHYKSGNSNPQIFCEAYELIGPLNCPVKYRWNSNSFNYEFVDEK